jgi:hypothetical protein
MVGLPLLCDRATKALNPKMEPVGGSKIDDDTFHCLTLHLVITEGISQCNWVMSLFNSDRCITIESESFH